MCIRDTRTRATRRHTRPRAARQPRHSTYSAPPLLVAGWYEIYAATGRERIGQIVPSAAMRGCLKLSHRMIAGCAPEHGQNVPGTFPTVLRVGVACADPAAASQPRRSQATARRSTPARGARVAHLATGIAMKRRVPRQPNRAARAERPSASASVRVMRSDAIPARFRIVGPFMFRPIFEGSLFSGRPVIVPD